MYQIFRLSSSEIPCHCAFAPYFLKGFQALERIMNLDPTAR